MIIHADLQTGIILVVVGALLSALVGMTEQPVRQFILIGSALLVGLGILDIVLALVR